MAIHGDYNSKNTYFRSNNLQNPRISILIHVLLKFYLLSFVLNGSMLCFDLSPFRSDLGIVDPSSNMSSPKGPLPGFSTPPPPSPFPDFEVTILFLYKNSFSRGFNVYLCCKNKASWKILTFINSSFYCSFLIMSFGTNIINKTITSFCVRSYNKNRV